MTEAELQAAYTTVKEENAQLRAEMERIGTKTQDILQRLETRIKDEARIRQLAILATMQLDAAQKVIAAYETGDRVKVLEAKEAYLSTLTRAQTYTSGHGEQDPNNPGATSAP